MSEESLLNVQRKMEDTSSSESRGRGGETAEEESGGSEVVSSHLRKLISDELSAFIVEQEGVDILTEYVCHMMQDGEEISEAHIRAELDEFLDDKTDAFASWLTINIVPKLPKSEPRQPQTRKWIGGNNNESNEAPLSASGNTAGNRQGSSHFGETASSAAGDSGSNSSPDSLKRGRTADAGDSSGGSGGGGGVSSSPTRGVPWYEDSGNKNRRYSGSAQGVDAHSREVSPSSGGSAGYPAAVAADGAGHSAAGHSAASRSKELSKNSVGQGLRNLKTSPSPKRPGDKRTGVFQQALRGLSENRHDPRLYVGSRGMDGHNHHHGYHHNAPQGSANPGSSHKSRRRFEMVADRDASDLHTGAGQYEYHRYRGGGGGSPWSVPASGHEWRRAGSRGGSDFRYSSRSRSPDGRNVCMGGRLGDGGVRRVGGDDALPLAGGGGEYVVAGGAPPPPQPPYHSSSGAPSGAHFMHNQYPPAAAQQPQNNNNVALNNNMHHIHRDSNINDRTGGMSDNTNMTPDNNSSFLPFAPRGPPQGAWGSPGMSRNFREPRSRLILRGDNSKMLRAQGHYRSHGPASEHPASAPLSPASYRRAGSPPVAPPPLHNEMIPHGVVVPPPYPVLSPRVADGLGPAQPPYIVGDVADVVMGDHARLRALGEQHGPQQAAGPAFDGMPRHAQQPPLQQPGGAPGKIKKRCANFPNCRYGDSCRYIHPSEMCKTWPHCQYGVECFYIHPEVSCKFGVNCYNWYCNYQHPPEWSPTFPTTANYMRGGGGGMNTRMMASMLTGGANKFSGLSNRFQVFKNRTLRETAAADFEEPVAATMVDVVAKTASPKTDSSVKSSETPPLAGPKNDTQVNAAA